MPPLNLERRNYHNRLTTLVCPSASLGDKFSNCYNQYSTALAVQHINQQVIEGAYGNSLVQSVVRICQLNSMEHNDDNGLPPARALCAKDLPRLRRARRITIELDYLRQHLRRGLKSFARTVRFVKLNNQAGRVRPER